MTPEEVLRRLSTTATNISKRYTVTCCSPRYLHDLIQLNYYDIVNHFGKVELDVGVNQAAWLIADVLCGKTQRWGLMLAGYLGNGKTTMIKAVQRAFVYLGAAGCIPYGEGLRLLEAKDIYNNFDIVKWRNEVFNEPLLAIDDLGVEPKETNIYGTIMTPIVDLLEYRYDRRLVTMVSTNLTRQQRDEKYGNRLADRFDEMFTVVPFNHKSYRQNANKNQQVRP